MRFCFCDKPVWGTDKVTKIGYCQGHQYMRTDLDKRSITEKAVAKHKVSAGLKSKINVLKENRDEEQGSMQSLINDLDRTFSLIVRLKDADKNGMNDCYTSGKRMHYLKLQAGHFISRSHLATRWMEENVKPQSEYENCHLHGNLNVFRDNLEGEHSGITDYLQEQARQVYKPSQDELKQLLLSMRERLKLLKSKLIK